MFYSCANESRFRYNILIDYRAQPNVSRIIIIKIVIELAIEHMLISVGYSIVLQDIVSGRELLQTENNYTV